MRRWTLTILVAGFLAGCGSDSGTSSDGARDASGALTGSPVAAETASLGNAPGNVPVAAASVAPIREFVICLACHRIEPDRPLIGPSLFGVYGRSAGSAPDYHYSQAMKESGLTWDDATLDAYLTRPQALMPGTKMAFAGIPDPARRKAVIDYLKTLR
ncbi:MAG: cytochrome c family protein [Novosphingobium sp.]